MTSIKDFIAAGDCTTGTFDSKSRIAPVSPYWSKPQARVTHTVLPVAVLRWRGANKQLDDMHVSARRPASKEGYQDTFRTKCSFREKSASFKAWDLESKQALGAVLSVDDLKNLDWPNSRMAIFAQLSGVYFQASGFGAVLNVKSIGLRAASAECPFALVDPED